MTVETKTLPDRPVLRATHHEGEVVICALGGTPAEQAQVLEDIYALLYSAKYPVRIAIDKNDVKFLIWTL